MFTNADINVTPLERRRREQAERNVERVDKQVKNTGTIGSSKKAVIGDKGSEVIATFDQLNDLRADEYRPVIPVRTELNEFGGWDHILTAADYHLVKEGRVCAKCLEWQEDVWTPTCRWRGKDRGCGHERNIDLDLAYKPSLTIR